MPRKTLKFIHVCLLISWGCYGLLSLALTLSPKPSLYGGRDFSAAVFDRHKKLMRLTLTRDDKYRLWSPLTAIEPRLIEATLLQEDQFFYWHPGINPWALTRAVISTTIGKTKLGASTITMQLARLRFQLQTRSISGKIQQMWEALRLEHYYSKNELIEAYLNLAPYGGNIEGIAAASQIYFRKSAANLTLADALLLSVLPQKPSKRAPISESQEHQESQESGGLAAARRRLLERWIARRPNDEKAAGETRMTKALQRRDQLPFRAPHFIDGLMRDRQATRGQQPLIGSVLSTLDLGLQTILERRLSSYIERKKGLGIRNGAVMLLDYRSMDVVALVGSTNFQDITIQGQVDGTRAMRSPGSTLKPFIYGLALDQGLIHPQSVLKDAPTSFGDWRPENYDRGFVGPIHATEALVRSRNVPAIQLASQLHKPSLYEFLKTAGIEALRDEDFYGLALALGGAEVKMEDLVRLYAMLANAGKLQPLRRLSSDPVASTDERQKTLLSPEAAELVVEMLRQNPRPEQGYDHRWTRNRLPVAWKTGTSYSFRDAWSVGIVGPYVLAVWLGNFNGESNPALIGLEAAGPFFFEVVDALNAYHGEGGMPPVAPAGLTKVKMVEVCALSGKMPGPNCRHTLKTGFIPGKSPITTCDIHRAVEIDQATGLRACPATLAKKNMKIEVFEFWPSDLQRLFLQAGLPRQVPPAFGPECHISETTHTGLPPRILSPKMNTTYHVRLSGQTRESIPLQASVDADAKDIHWFANNTYLGQSRPTQPFYWQPIPGRFAVRAVDNLGRSASRSINVVVIE